METDSLKLIVLDNPYATWDEVSTQNLFAKMVQLKLTGYRAEYPYGVLPVDTSDFIGTHFLLCERRKSDFFPIMAYRSITASRCKEFNLLFSGIGLPRSAGANEHEAVVREIVGACEISKKEISYDSSWTIHPQIRKDRPYTKNLREMMTAMQVFHHREYGIPEIIGGGVVRLKTEKYFFSIGYEAIKKNNLTLPPIKNPFLCNEEIVVMHLKKFNEEIVTQASRFSQLWEDRIEIAPRDFNLVRAA